MLRLFILQMLLSAAVFAKSKIPEELVLPDAFRQLVEKDLPISQFVVHNDQTVIFLGKSCLWRWNLSQNDLKKLCRNRLFPKDSNTFLSAFYVLSPYILIASEKEIVEFNPASQAVVRYGINLLEAEYIQKIFGEGDFVWLSTNLNLYRIDRYGKQVKVEPATQKSFNEHSLFLPDEAARRLVVATPNASGFLLSALQEGKWSYSKGEIPQEVKALGKIDKKIIVAASKTIQTLSETFIKSKEIPVQNQRNILQAHFSFSKHAFLFDDGLCELYDTSGNGRVSLDFNTSSLNVSIGRVRAIEAFASYVVLLDERYPRVFVY